MTLPKERTSAVLRVRAFLVRLASPYGGGVKGVKTEVREEARRLLRHFPGFADLWQASRQSPDVFACPTEEEGPAWPPR